MVNETKIAVVGAGTMGPGIAQTYAAAGYEVWLYSRTEKTLKRAKDIIFSSLQFLENEGRIENGEAAAERVHYTTDLACAVQDAWYVVESISERPDDKQKLYEKLDGMLSKDTIISSNTSYMDIFELMPPVRQPHAVIVHWIAPPQLLPLVEAVRGPQTTQEVINAMMQLHRICQKIPIRIERYIPGFIINRLQSAMTREVVYLIENGYCTKEDVDLAVKTSLMPRGMLLGVIQRMDFGGLDVAADGLENKQYIPAPAPDHPGLIFIPCERGDLGVKTGRGIYDYTHQSYAEVIRHRDQQLLQSVRLAENFLKDPLHRSTCARLKD